MEQHDTPASPRKKVKTDHDLSNDLNMSVAPSKVEMEVNSVAAPSSATDEQYEKERLCGITEFVSPDSSGFSGILKKR